MFTKISVYCACVFAAAAALPARADTTAGTCSTNAIAFRMSDDGLVTTSTTPKAIPGTAVNFVQGGNTPGCVVVQFSSLANTTTTNASFIYFDLDGVQHNELYANKLSTGQTGRYAIVYVFQNVAPERTPYACGLQALMAWG